MKKGIIVITGQTATGKTKLALQLAKKYNGELVNADSRQIYRYLDIVTGKDTEEIKAQHVQIYLLDLVAPDKFFSSYEYTKRATCVIDEILKKEKTPILVGGTYLYIKHLLYGIDTEGVKPNDDLRNKFNDLSVQELQTILFRDSKFNKSTMNNSDWNNPRRLIRRIELLQNSGSYHPLSSAITPQFDLIEYIGLRHINRQHLENTIKKRVEDRLQKGAIDEAKRILAKGYNATDPGLQTIGYKQIFQYIAGKKTLEEAVAEWATREIQYAKRQYTFMKKDKYIKWITAGD